MQLRPPAPNHLLRVQTFMLFKIMLKFICLKGSILLCYFFDKLNKAAENALNSKYV